MVDATIIKYNTVTKLIEKEYLIGENNFENIPLEQIIDINGQIIDYENNFGVCLSRHSDSVHYLWIGDHKEHTRISIHDKSWFILFISYLRLTYEIIRMNEDSVNQLIEGERLHLLQYHVFYSILLKQKEEDLLKIFMIRFYKIKYIFIEN